MDICPETVLPLRCNKFTRCNEKLYYISLLIYKKNDPIYYIGTTVQYGSQNGDQTVFCNDYTAKDNVDV